MSHSQLAKAAHFRTGCSHFYLSHVLASPARRETSAPGTLACSGCLMSLSGNNLCRANDQQWEPGHVEYTIGNASCDPFLYSTRTTSRHGDDVAPSHLTRSFRFFSIREEPSRGMRIRLNMLLLLSWHGQVINLSYSTPELIIKAGAHKTVPTKAEMLTVCSQKDLGSGLTGMAIDANRMLSE